MLNSSIRQKIIIIDYGMGNLRSVQKKFLKVNANVEITCDPNSIAKADKLVLPGVGHFANGVRSSNYNCFKIGICKGIQEIEITKDRVILIDRKEIDRFKFLGLIANDGFEDELEFWAWFDKYLPFKGKLIHWTDFKY